MYTFFFYTINMHDDVMLDNIYTEFHFYDK